MRHSRLIISFGFLGGAFGCLYAVFYTLLGHYYGAAIVVICDLAFLSVPWLLKKSQWHFSAYGHFLCAVLTIGFSALAGIEGGIRGHAITWLAAVPFCAVLLIDVRASYLWCAICTGITVLFSILHFSGVILPFYYQARWHGVITMAGYVGLAVFLFLLAQIFERGRTDAQAKMLQAYQDLARVTNQLVQSNDDLALANQQLVRVDREKNEFIGIAAHDLKNPLVAVLGYSEILSMQTSPTRLQNEIFGQRIKDSAERMLNLIRNLLNINEMDEGRLRLNRSGFNACKLIEQVIASQQMAARAKDITIHFSPGAVRVFADSGAMLQILENFVSNAVKYSPVSRNIYIDLKLTEGRVVLEVRDEGPGLSEEDQSKLFQRFSRLTPRPTGGESSNGLGLSIVKRLAEAMDGHVGCSSELGKGTIFWVSLPSDCAAAAA